MVYVLKRGIDSNVKITFESCMYIHRYLIKTCINCCIKMKMKEKIEKIKNKKTSFQIQ